MLRYGSDPPCSWRNSFCFWGFNLELYPVCEGGQTLTPTSSLGGGWSLGSEATGESCAVHRPGCHATKRQGMELISLAEMMRLCSMVYHKAKEELGARNGGSPSDIEGSASHQQVFILLPSKSAVAIDASPLWSLFIPSTSLKGGLLVPTCRCHEQVSHSEIHVPPTTIFQVRKDISFIFMADSTSNQQLRREFD